MKNLLKAVILGIALAGAALAQASSEPGGRQGGQTGEVKMAVVEFSPGPNASVMTPEARRQLQAGLASAIAKTNEYDVADVRWTRNESQAHLATINGGASTAAAVKLGKQLGVSYVLTGTVAEYSPKGADGFGRLVLKTRLIEVATGKVRHSEEKTQRSTSAMNTSGAAEMQSKAVMPAVKSLAATLAELKL